jgi:hypothetical protein
MLQWGNILGANMAGNAIQRNIHAQDADSYTSGLICALAAQANEYGYGYSYYWWYYGIPTSNRHAVGKSD